MISRHTLLPVLQEVYRDGLRAAKQTLVEMATPETRLILNAIGMVKSGACVAVTVEDVQQKQAFNLKEAAGAIRLTLESRTHSLLVESLAEQLVAGTLDSATAVNTLRSFETQ